MTEASNVILKDKNKSFLFGLKQILFNHPSTFIGIFMLTGIFLLAIIGPLFHSYTYFSTNLPIKNLSPSWSHWFGTDELGRDLFIRACYGARISLIVGICAALIDFIIGIIWGMTAALFGGKIDEIMMRFCDILSSIPYLLVVILLMVILGPGIITVLISLTFTGWINMARVVRAQSYGLKNKEYILAAIIMGASKKRIICKHLLPNSIGPVLATITVTIPMAIFTEAFLSFLGLGIQAPIASWGVMVNDGISALRFYPWRLFFPAFLIFITMLSFNLIGDGIRDSVDPRIIR